MNGDLKVSIIIPVRYAGGTIRSTLTSLLVQADDTCEVIAVVSANDPTVRELREIEHPRLRVYEVAGSGVPQIRRHGAERAQAPFVIIAEDHCLFPQNWVRGLVEAIERTGADASGGPVVNGRVSYAGWAQYFTRYSVFLPPVTEGWTVSLPGNNACYRREALMALTNQEGGFWEAELNQQLILDGGRMWMCADSPVVQRQERGALEYVPLRFRHGRCYGARRVAALPHERTRLLLRCLLIPAVLFARALRAVMTKRTCRLRFVLASPLLAVYILAWSAGEIVGYLFGAGGACQETD